MKKYINITLLLLISTFVSAQDFFDALKYSQTEYGGTARSIAMGSAFGSLGGDFASASINPAGLGIYRSGEFAVSPTLNINQISSSYYNNSEINDKYNFNFNNISWVTSSRTGAETGILSFSLGIGYNRLKNFSSNTFTQGYETNTTLLNYYTDYANEINDQDYFDYHYEGLAWNTWLIDIDSNADENAFYNDLGNYSYYDIKDNNGNIIGTGREQTGVKPHQQKNTIERTGHIDEYLVSLGMNINHKVYVGASIGLLDLTYIEKKMFSEIDNNNQSDFFKSYTLNTNLSEDGFGANFKLGVIFRPTKSLRLGAAIHTPNFFDISRVEYKVLTADYDQAIGDDAGGYKATWTDDSEFEYDYKLETPLKANFSGSYTFGNAAILSADYELVNYKSAKFRNSGDNYDYSDKNSEITHTLKTSGNLRIGGEFRLTPNVSLRAGYNLFGNPWQSTFKYEDGTTSEILNSNDSYSSYSAGFGYRQNDFYIDFAYRLSVLNYDYQVHEIYYTNPSGSNAVASNNEYNSQATITFGFRF